MEQVQSKRGATTRKRSAESSIAEVARRVSAKRQPAQLDPLEQWLPYYAGYTQTFARSILEAAGAGRKQLNVLDPWNGSGTTTRAALELGHSAIGLDINPVAALAASAKLANAADALHVHGLVQHLAAAKPSAELHASDPLLQWVPRAVASEYRAIQRGILAELGTTSGGKVLNPLQSSLPPLASFLLLALIRATRAIASFHPSSNPTWSRPARTRPRGNWEKLGVSWERQVAQMGDELNQASDRVSPGGAITIKLANSKALPVDDSVVDLVLASPPYCTRIDYAKSVSFELSALGLGEDTNAYRLLRLDSMGTPLSRPVGADSARHFPSPIRSVLNSIREHPSKASSTYYYRTYEQYFHDCRDSLGEIMRVLRPGGVAALIVQSSYYKEVYVDLPNLYVAQARQLGFTSSVAGVTQVRKAFSQLNPKSRAYMHNKSYEESLVVMEKNI